MNPHDAYYERAMRDLYRDSHQGLYPIEQSALLDLCVQHADFGPPDLLWAMVPQLREDGAAQLVVLTVDRVEAYANLYAARGYSIEASTEPTQRAKDARP